MCGHRGQDATSDASAWVCVLNRVFSFQLSGICLFLFTASSDSVWTVWESVLCAEKGLLRYTRAPGEVHAQLFLTHVAHSL